MQSRTDQPSYICIIRCGLRTPKRVPRYHNPLSHTVRRDLEDRNRQRLEAEGGSRRVDDSSAAIYDPVRAALGAIPTIQGVRAQEEVRRGGGA